jgi:hypothetical protein
MAAQQLQQQLAAQQMLAEQQQQHVSKQRTSQEGGVPTAIPLTTPAAPGAEPIRFEDLELRRVIGTGQFGLVRVVRHVPTNAVYALKVSYDGRMRLRPLGYHQWICRGSCCHDALCAASVNCGFDTWHEPAPQ